ncbi:MAG: hypothetical protein A2076_12720 [Geobacteraceae bacterium GWC2_53_11]|nr:MAG: hypothetical protein A2076_12720 [Geobacteraceae bacterium GWC2_53_11]
MDLNYPIISIVIPVYNGSNYLQAAIDSALAQTYRDVEVIVVNDGSCDEGKTEAIAQSYGARIRYVSKENGGVASALNMGIRLAQGDYISWLSHDDIYLPDKVKRQVSLMRRQTHQRVIIYSDYEALHVDKDKLFSCKISHLTPDNYLRNMLQLLFRSELHGCSMLIPKDCFEEVGFFSEQLRTTQDYDLWFKLLRYGYEFVHLPEVLIRVRWHQNQGTLSMFDIHVREVENLYVWAFDQFRKEIITFPAEEIHDLITVLRRRTLKIAPDYIAASVRSADYKLFCKLGIRLLCRNFTDRFKALIMKTASVGLYLVPQVVQNWIFYLIDRYVFFIKIDRTNHSRSIVFVVLPESLHTARWINQFIDQGWDLHVFPALDTGKVHPELKNTTVYYSFYGDIGINEKSGNRYQGIYLPTSMGVFAAVLLRSLLQRFYPSYRAHQLSRLIRRINPDVVHSMEFQIAGYLTLEVREVFGKEFPKWIATNWGNDIYLYGKLHQHQPIIRRLLECCDYYSCECNRDVVLARENGFKGVVLPVFPNTGGYDLALAKKLQHPGPISERRLIMLKGYGLERGRAVSALRALERCADLLKENNYQIVIYLASHDVIFAANLLASTTDVDIRVFPFSADAGRQHYALSHEEILRLHGQARISINNNISDGIAISLLDAMVMGSFPIHSCGACGDEWFDDGITGLIVSPNDPEEIEAAIRKALTDDDLVNKAAAINWNTALERLDYTELRELSVQFYSRVFTGSEGR